MILYKNSLFRLLSVLLIVSFLFISCDAAEEKDVYLRFQDDRGESVVLREKPTRVAVLFSSLADVYLTAGGSIAITVGESIERGFCSDSTPLVDVGAGKAINEELLLSYAPDLVIGSLDVAAQVNAADTLRAAGIPTALFRIESFRDYLRVLDVCTDVTGKKEAYTTFGTEVAAEIDEILGKVDDESPSPRVLFLRAATSAKATKAKSADRHFAAAMLRDLGAENIADNAQVLLDGISVETVLTENPDRIFITTMGDEAASRAYIEGLFKDSVWQSLDAVKNNRYYFLDKELFQYKPNARWAESYRVLWELLYENE